MSVNNSCATRENSLGQWRSDEMAVVVKGVRSGRYMLLLMRGC